MTISDVAETHRPALRRDLVWSARLWAVVLAFVCVGVARSLHLGIPFRDPGGEYFSGRLALSLAIFSGFVLVDAVVRARPSRDLASVAQVLRVRWDRGRLTAASAALLAYDVTYFTYHNLKSWDVFNAPRDAMLERWDRALFAGHSPAVVLHDLLGTGLTANVVMLWYSSFALLALLALPATIALSRRTRDGFVGTASLCWVWILGTATYYLIPSLGPFHVAPQDFASLPGLEAQRTQAKYLDERAYLLAHPAAHDAFAQVSAFASLHVGVTATILGLAWWHRMRRTTVVLGVYLAGTMVATVYLGWHFFVDVPAGLAIAGLAWVLGPVTIGVRGRPERPS
ncbi:phosphatase PAP2 family protein [Marmoricola sp. RAF53]|uniref:phosphatase PAP2 family protein n=1 Tax=Marmoricola sp. RAF53 TaxID=3233059 RepID=UPI003F9E232D